MKVLGEANKKRTLRSPLQRIRRNVCVWRRSGTGWHLPGAISKLHYSDERSKKTRPPRLISSREKGQTYNNNNKRRRRNKKGEREVTRQALGKPLGKNYANDWAIKIIWQKELLNNRLIYRKIFFRKRVKNNFFFKRLG